LVRRARRRLAGFARTIQTDAYEVYESLHRQANGIVRIGCLAHARRYMYKALQENFSHAVWLRFAPSTASKMKSAVSLRRNDMPCVRSERPKSGIPWSPEPKSFAPTYRRKATLGKAINYFLNDYDALTGYLSDGRFEIDNNLVENAIRPTAVGPQTLALYRPPWRRLAQRRQLLDPR
jgi:transposase